MKKPTFGEVGLDRRTAGQGQVLGEQLVILTQYQNLL
jgi:hypothetical protein